LYLADTSTRNLSIRSGKCISHRWVLCFRHLLFTHNQFR